MALTTGLLSVLATLVALLVLPVATILLCSLARRVVDDRGLYRRKPLLALPIIAGGLIEGYVLAATGLVERLTPGGIWGREGWWHLDLRGLYETYLSAPVIAELYLRTAETAGAAWPANAHWAAMLVALFLPVALCAMSTWRSLRALPAMALFVPIALTAAVVVHTLIVLTFWTLYWLNFWIFFVLFALLEMRRHEAPGSDLLRP